MFTLKVEERLNGMDIRVFELDQLEASAMSSLESYLIKKIRSMKIHKELVGYDVLNVPILSPEFTQKLKRDFNNPKSHPLPQFDVRRSRVTEFMSQLLLENEFQCMFFDEADKRLKLEPYQADRHVAGVDVTGVRNNGNENAFTFVLCEVKASESGKIPCRSAKDLLKDIRRSIDDSRRVLREIESYYLSLKDTSREDFKYLLEFLLEILQQQSSQQVISERLLFIPFLIRGNKKIIEERNLDDFRDFKRQDLNGANLTGVIWSVDFDIDEFSIDVYDRATQNA